jgi:hypothetical protein
VVNTTWFCLGTSTKLLRYLRWQLEGAGSAPSGFTIRFMIKVMLYAD